MPEEYLADLAASVQEAIVDALVEKSIRGIRSTQCETLVLAGGVAANKRFREKAAVRCKREGYRLTLTPLSYCTDNAAMIAGIAYQKYQQGQRDGLDLNASANSDLGQ